MSHTRKNPFDPAKVSGTLYIMAGLALGTKELKAGLSSGNTLLKEVNKIPDPADPANYKPFIEAVKQWLLLYIENTKNTPPFLGSLARKIELIDVLKASLKAAEIQDLDPALNKLKENFQKIQEARDKLKEENQSFTTGYIKQGQEAMKMISLQPAMARSQPMVQIYNKQTETQRLMRLNLTREREKVEKANAEATRLVDQLTHRMPAEKVREIEEKTMEQKPGVDLSAGA